MFMAMDRNVSWNRPGRNRIGFFLICLLEAWQSVLGWMVGLVDLVTLVQGVFSGSKVKSKDWMNGFGQNSCRITYLL